MAQQGKAYKTGQLFEMAKEAIVKAKLLFIEDVCAYIGVAKQTFYKHVSIGSDEMDEIKRLISDNRIRMKVSMRKKWYESDNPTLQLTLYRLMATTEEHQAMNTNYVKAEVTSKGVKEMTDEELDAAIKEYEDKQ